MKDIVTLMDSLDEHKVYRIQPGRVLEDDEVVKDVIGIGLQHLSEGTKNPIREFNKAFQGLQKRRKMKAVSALAEEHLTEAQTESPPATAPNLNPRPPQAASHTPLSLSRPPSNSEDVAMVSTAVETQVSEGDVQMGEMEESPTELEQILDDLVHGEIEATLPRSTSDDVALDMDEVEIEEDLSDGSDDSEWETDEEEESE